MNRIASSLIAVFVVLLLLSSMVFVVDQRRYAIVFALGQIKEVIREPGLHFKLPPPFQNVLYLDNRILTIESADAERFITAEKMNILVDSFVKWRIGRNEGQAKLYYVTFGGDETRARDRMSVIVKAALNEEITKHTVSEVISGKRGKVMEAIRTKVVQEAAQIGVEIIDVRLKRVEYVEQINNSVYERMKSERVRVANELRSTGSAESEKIRADADRQREVTVANAYRDAQKIKGEGDAMAASSYSEAFGRDPQFAQFYRSLDAYKQSFNKKSDVLVVDPASSDFFKALRSPGNPGSNASR